jgi:thymidine kinase
MAKLYFYYSAMNAGKSTTLLQSAHNYEERGMKALLYTPIIDNRYAVGLIKSRIGIERKCTIFDSSYNFYEKIKELLKNEENVKCILIDEAQFLSKKQVAELTDIVDDLNIPILTYGIRTDFQGMLFPGSEALLAIADEIIEIKTICRCGKKAAMNMRINEDGSAVIAGNQIAIGGNELYVSMCRKCFKLETRKSALITA